MHYLTWAVMACAAGVSGAVAQSQTAVTDSLQRAAMAAYRTMDFPRAALAFAKLAEITSSSTAMYNAAAMHARMGHRDSAFAWLTRATTAGFRGLATLRTDADLDSLRPDPRFAALLTDTERRAMPCTHTPDARRLDFWVGEWDVRDPQGQVIGHSVVEHVSGQCALLENWTDGFGGTGKSLSAFNALLSRWQQFWVGQAGTVIEFRDSRWDGNALTLLATSATDGTQLTRMTLRPLSADTVLQRGDRSTDSGMTWTLRYEYTYHRRQR